MKYFSYFCFHKFTSYKELDLQQNHVAFLHNITQFRINLKN